MPIERAQHSNNSMYHLVRLGDPAFLPRFLKRCAAFAATVPDQVRKALKENDIDDTGLKCLVMRGVSSVLRECIYLRFSVLLSEPATISNIRTNMNMENEAGGTEVVGASIRLFSEGNIDPMNLVRYLYSLPLLFGPEDHIKAPPDLPGILKRGYAGAMKDYCKVIAYPDYKTALDALFSACRYSYLYFSASESGILPATFTRTVETLFTQTNSGQIFSSKIKSMASYIMKLDPGKAQ